MTNSKDNEKKTDNGDENSPEKKAKVVESEKRLPSRAKDYWTEEEIKKSKPISFPKPKAGNSDPGDDGSEEEEESSNE